MKKEDVDRMIEHAAKSIAEEIDWGVMRDALKESGWTLVTLNNAFLPCTGSELHEWRVNNLTGGFHAHNHEWIFEHRQDAVIFMLRWAQ